MKKSFRAILLVSLLLVLSFLFIRNFPGREELKLHLIAHFTRIEPLAEIPSNTVLYVLGGHQNSLLGKFDTAAELYRRGADRKILFLSETGITEYDPRLARNLTKNEWSIRQLARRGVRKKDIEAVELKSGFFGTLSEARGLSALAEERGYRAVIVITSHYHTLRTWIAFSAFFQKRGITLAVYPADDRVGLRGLFLEYAKLALYRNIVLPLSD